MIAGSGSWSDERRRGVEASRLRNAGVETDFLALYANALGSQELSDDGSWPHHRAGNNYATISRWALQTEGGYAGGTVLQGGLQEKKREMKRKKAAKKADGDAARRNQGGGQRCLAQGSACVNQVCWTD